MFEPTFAATMLPWGQLLARSLNRQQRPNLPPDLRFSVVEVRGFEPLTPAVRRQCSTGLSYTPVLG